MISELLDQFPIRGWRTHLLNCLNDEILNEKYSAVLNTNTAPRLKDCLNDEMLAKKYSSEMNTNTAGRDLYYYWFPGDRHEQALFSTKFTNTRATFLTRSLRSILENLKTYFPISINGVMGTCDTYQLMKLIELCCIENNWDSLSFFDNTLR